MYFFIEHDGNFSFIIILLVVLCSCSSDPGSSHKIDFQGTFKKANLQDITVNKINAHNSVVYAGTEQGLYRKNSGASPSNWTPLFQQKSILDFVVWNQQELLIGTPLSSPQEVSIFISRDGGNSWQPYQNGFGTEDKNNHLAVVEKHPQNPTILFGRGDFNVAMSPDSGQSWENVIGSWDGFGGGFFLTIDTINPDIIWGGGTTATFSAHLFKTTDGGSSWQNIDILKNVETTVYDLAVHPSRSNTVLAGLGIGIRRSTDGGESWETVLENIGTRTLTHSDRNPQVVYASGIKASGTLFFAASGDFGDDC
jgi:photosystem II stability/assembly factor-like uncharacterized protein